LTESRPVRLKKKRRMNGGGGCVANRGQQKRDIVDGGEDMQYLSCMGNSVRAVGSSRRDGRERERGEGSSSRGEGRTL
jgi:hypothetical protein